MLKFMDNPHNDFSTIHVAGTNGKGSVSLIIASVLQKAGYRVGRFISPHIHSYRERFSINGEEIEENILVEYLNKIANKIKELGPTFEGVTEFELLTALAVQYFKDNKVDIAVLETGLGGLYDSTNIVNPVISVITGVDYDHQAYLGNTLEEIAFNKAGIIKPGIPVVVGDMDIRAFTVINNRAAQVKARLFKASTCQVQRLKSPSVSEGQTVSINYPGLIMRQVKFSLLGDFQLHNLAVAITALMVLKQRGYNFTAEHIVHALAFMHHPGRLEFISNKPPIVVDVAHNPQAAKSLAQSLNTIYPSRQRVLVCGILDDKDSMGILRQLGKNCRLGIITRPESVRAVNWRRVAQDWQLLYPEKCLIIEEDIEEAVKAGIRLLRNGEYLLLAGSFCILDRARSYFRYNL